MFLRSTGLGFAFAAIALAQSVIHVVVHANVPAGPPIPRTIFSSFLEPIGNSTYNGLWAEIIQNPSFENGLWSTATVRNMVSADPELLAASQLSLPVPWEPLYADEGNRYEPRRGDAANSFQSIALFGLPDREVGVRQQVYLPAHRELTYRGSVFVKHESGGDVVRVSLRKRNDPNATLAAAEFHTTAHEWRKYSFTLALKPGALARLEPADFVISVPGSSRILVDEASLIPSDALGGLDPEMVQLAKNMHSALVRFGGNFTSSYHWRDGIGPVDKRVSMRNVAWGIPETNQFGTDEFLHFCELVGAQPQIALNLGTGTPEEAADWVRYVDEHWTKHSGLLWELGNELWGDWNDAYPTLSQVAGRTLEFSKAVRRVDPQSRLIATGQDPDHFQEWNEQQLTNPPGTFNFLSTHFVVTTDSIAGHDRSPAAIAMDTFALPVALERKLHEMQQQIDRAGRPDTHIAFTEWLFHCCSKGGAAPSFNNFGGAIAAAGFMNMLLRNSDIVPISDMTGIIEFAGIWKKRSQVFGTPSYYAFKMFSNAEPVQRLQVDSDSPAYNVRGGISRLPDIPNVPYLDIVAARSAKPNVISVFAVNRSLKNDLTATIALESVSASNTADIQQLVAPDIYAVNDEVHPAAVQPSASAAELNHSGLRFVFPRASVTRIDFTVK